MIDKDGSRWVFRKPAVALHTPYTQIRFGGFFIAPNMAITELNINPPEPSVIDLLEELLEDARSGRLQSIAIAASLSDAATANAWAGMGKNNMAILGELVALQHELINSGSVELRWQPICE